jgi:hypothetical protein
MSRRGCGLPANASGVDPHRASISRRFGQVWETNTARHDFSRVVAEASDINDLQREGWQDSARVDQRVESFCMEKSGHDPCLDSKHGFCGDQGAIFFSPNATWGQPPYHLRNTVILIVRTGILD